MNQNGGTFTGAESTFTDSFGLGACSPDQGLETSTSCIPPSHQIDDKGHYEFLLFQFSSPVALSSITLQSFSDNLPVFNTLTDGRSTSYLAGCSSPSGLTLAAIEAGAAGCGAEVDTTNTPATNPVGPVANPPITELFGPGGTVTVLLFGASIPNGAVGDDYFKIQSLSVVATPEPATLGLIGSALLALSLYRRRKS